MVPAFCVQVLMVSSSGGMLGFLRPLSGLGGRGSEETACLLFSLGLLKEPQGNESLQSDGMFPGV